jgi:hypothetical protein
MKASQNMTQLRHGAAPPLDESTPASQVSTHVWTGAHSKYFASQIAWGALSRTQHAQAFAVCAVRHAATMCQHTSLYSCCDTPWQAI